MQDLVLGAVNEHLLPYLFLALFVAVTALLLVRSMEPEPPRWDRYEEDYPPPTAEELAEIERSRGPGAFRLHGRGSAVARHFFTAPKHSRISYNGGRHAIGDNPPNVVDEWYEDRE